MRQKIITFLISLVLLPYIDLNAEEIDGFNYKLVSSNKTAAVMSKNDATGDIVIPDQVTYNGITYKVTSIANFAFEDTQITSVSFGKNIVEIGMYAFGSCQNLTTLIIPDNITKLNIGSFNECTTLTKVTVGSGIKSIQGFGFCTALTSVTLPTTLTEISWSAFQGCEKLANMIIPDGVESISDEAFEGCTSLETINIPKKLTDIARDAFNNCTAMKTFNVDPDNSEYSSLNGILYNKAQTNIIVVPNGIAGEVSIPGTITEVGPNIFRNCYFLESIVLMDGVKTIGSNAFRDCVQLKKVTMPGSMKDIEDWAFYGCTELTSVSMSPNLTSIGYYAFLNCTKLLSITIPDGVTILKELTFSQCHSLTKINLGTGLTTIEDKAFFGCLSLDTIVVSKNVTSIGKEAFGDCKTLSSVTLGEKVTTLSDKAFSSCTNIKEILTLNPVPPVCSTDMFYIIVPNTAKLYVAHGSVDAYKNAEVWKTFKKVTELYEDGKKPVTATVSKEGNGNILINGKTVDTSVNVKEGTDVTISFNPDNGYMLTEATLDDENIFGNIVNGNYIIKKVSGNFAVSAIFKQVSTVNVVYDGNKGNVTVNGKSVTSAQIENGKPVKFIVTPNTLYYVDKVLVNDQQVQLNAENTYEISAIDKNITFEVSFETIRKITAEYDKKLGSVKINDQEISSFDAKKGDEIKFSITPNEGNKIEDVLLNNISITNEVKDRIYTFNATENAYFLKVTFTGLSSIGYTEYDGLWVYSGKGKVIIENIPDKTSITIIDNKGATVYEGIEKEIGLPCGFYIVKTGDKITKVMIR